MTLIAVFIRSRNGTYKYKLMAPSIEYKKTKLNGIVRYSDKASYALDDVLSIVDSCLCIHLSYVLDDGYPAMQPMIGGLSMVYDS